MAKEARIDAKLKMRRQPVQVRSHERVEKIIAITEKLILKHGVAALSVRDVARRSDTNIATFYQFFPNRNALIRKIVERYAARLASRINQIVATFESDDMPGSFAQLHAGLFQFYLDNPIAMELWPGALADPDLQIYDTQDTQQNAERVGEIIAMFRPDVDGARCLALGRVLAYTTGPFFRQVRALPQAEREPVLKLNLKMIITAIESL